MSSKTRTNGRPPLPTTALHALDLYLPAVHVKDSERAKNRMAGGDEATGSGNAWLVCPDCSHWVEVIRGLVQTHRPGGRHTRRCPGSAQLIEFDLTVEQHTMLCAAARQWLRAKHRTHPVRPVLPTRRTSAKPPKLAERRTAALAQLRARAADQRRPQRAAVLHEGQRYTVRLIAAHAAQQYAEQRYAGQQARIATAAALETVWEQVARVPAAPAPCQIAERRARDLAEQTRTAAADTSGAGCRFCAAQPVERQVHAAALKDPDKAARLAGCRVAGHGHPEAWFSATELAFANPYANADEVIDVAAGEDAAAARAETAARLAHAAIVRAPTARSRGRAAGTIKYRFVADVALVIGMDDINSRTVRQAHRLAVAELRDAGQRDLAARLTGRRRSDRTAAPHGPHAWTRRALATV